jgi:hypothetical protein
VGCFTAGKPVPPHASHLISISFAIASKIFFSKR